MTSLDVIRCGQDDALWADYFLLLMAHYPELTLPYTFPEAFSFIGNPIIQGDALLVREPGVRTVGGLGFIFLSDAHTNASICQVESLYLCEDARKATTLYRLLHIFSAYLSEHASTVETIRFWSPADREDLRKLFGKCCQLVKTNEKDFGRIDLFECHPAHLAQYTSRLRSMRPGRPSEERSG